MESSLKERVAVYKDIPNNERGGQFVAVLAIYDPVSQKFRTCEGVCRGVITTEARGENGFGFDPVFYNERFRKTNAEMSPEEKNSVSHRFFALKKAYDILKKESN